MSDIDCTYVGLHWTNNIVGVRGVRGVRVHDHDPPPLPSPYFLYFSNFPPPDHLQFTLPTLLLSYHYFHHLCPKKTRSIEIVQQGQFSRTNHHSEKKLLLLHSAEPKEDVKEG